MVVVIATVAIVVIAVLALPLSLCLRCRRRRRCRLGLRRDCSRDCRRLRHSRNPTHQLGALRSVRALAIKVQAGAGQEPSPRKDSLHLLRVIAHRGHHRREVGARRDAVGMLVVVVGGCGCGSVRFKMLELLLLLLVLSLLLLLPL